jgi:hypothetical protein
MPREMGKLQCSLHYQNCNQTIRLEIPESADQMMTNSVPKGEVWFALEIVHFFSLPVVMCPKTDARLEMDCSFAVHDHHDLKVSQRGSPSTVDTLSILHGTLLH